MHENFAGVLVWGGIPDFLVFNFHEQMFFFSPKNNFKVFLKTVFSWPLNNQSFNSKFQLCPIVLCIILHAYFKYNTRVLFCTEIGPEMKLYMNRLCLKAEYLYSFINLWKSLGNHKFSSGYNLCFVFFMELFQNCPRNLQAQICPVVCIQKVILIYFILNILNFILNAQI